MSFFLHTIQGLQNGAFPWSMTMVSESTESEATVQTTWDTAATDLWGTTSLKAFIPALTTLTETSTSTASATFRQTTKTVNTHSIAGTSSDVSIGYRTCEIISFTSLFATRWGRGRWYFPSLATNALDTDGYILSADAVAALVDGMDAFFTALGGTVLPQILHRKAPQGNPVSAYSTSVINGANVPNTLATQRRRADKLVPTRSAVTV
jgi:hypothetical protein